MLWSLCFITEAVGSKWNISCWGNDMARRVRHQSWGMYAKNNPNQREVGFFFIIGKKIIKLLPQLWVEIFAFSLEIQLHLLLCGFCAGTFLIWSCKQSYQMAPVLCTVRACLPVGADEWTPPLYAWPLHHHLSNCNSGLSQSNRHAWRLMSPFGSRPLLLNHLSEALRVHYLVEH